MISPHFVEVTRGHYVESVHHGTVAVVDPIGHLIAYWSDPNQATFMRSSAKPFQALPFLESGAAEALNLSDEELAMVCASHTGLARHLDILQPLLERAELAEGQLQCGIHRPLDNEAALALKAAGREPSVLHNNCAGKHIGMLATAKHLGHALDDYLALSHPVQQAIAQALSAIADVTIDQIGVATDGCSAPNFSIPIKSIALAYARLADPTEESSVSPQALARVFEAMAHNPTLVSGPTELDAILMKIGAGDLVAKVGAEGVLGIALRNHQGGAFGIAIKVWDGDKSGRALAASALAVLTQLGWLDQEQRRRAAAELPLSIETRRGAKVGEVRPSFQLERADG